MRNVADVCVQLSTDSRIKFEENKRKIIFLNPERRTYKKVQVDGCAINDKAMRCDKLLVSDCEHEERYVELKGTDVMHAIDQLEATIQRIGEFDNNRHSYVISTNVYKKTLISKLALLILEKFSINLLSENCTLLPLQV